MKLRTRIVNIAKLLKKKFSKGFLLFELLISTVILASATAGIIQVFIVSENHAMKAMILNHVSNILRQEVEMVISTPYQNVGNTSYTTNLLKLADGTTAYKMTVSWVVSPIGPPGGAYSGSEPPFKIVNVEGVWSFRGLTYTNIIQTVATP
jgi:hypothetical protein